MDLPRDNLLLVGEISVCMDVHRLKKKTVPEGFSIGVFHSLNQLSDMLTALW
jgi:hypothetical protein